MGMLQQLRAFTPLITKCVDALVALVLRLLLLDRICVYVCEWMAYYYLMSKKAISKPDSGCGEGGLKVIICGFPRSGTLTLQKAMDTLGFPCFHGVNLFKPGQCRLFMKARKSGKREDWDCLLKGYTSISDLPATTCYKNLLELYPNAKVILNIRDASKWYKSFSETILKVTHMIPPLGIHTCTMEALFKDMLRGKEKDMESAMHMYNLHTKEVMAHMRSQSSRLLVYEIGENTRGWAPLCEFLEVEAPLMPFPRSNDSQAFRNFFFLITSMRSIVVATYFTILAFIVLFMMKLLG